MKNAPLNQDNLPLIKHFSILRDQSFTKHQAYLAIAYSRIIASIQHSPIHIHNLSEASKLKGVGKSTLLTFQKYFDASKNTPSQLLPEAKPITDDSKLLAKRKRPDKQVEDVKKADIENKLDNPKGMNALIVSTYLALQENKKSPVNDAQINSQFQEKLLKYIKTPFFSTKLNVIHHTLIHSGFFNINQNLISLNRDGTERALELIKANGFTLDDTNTLTATQNINEYHFSEDMKKRIQNTHNNTTKQKANIIASDYEMVMILDNREVKAKDDRMFFSDCLKEIGVNIERRNLSMGDIIWVIRNKVTHEEKVIDYIIERKKMDDLTSSICDGRYDEQRYRLKKSGYKPIYLVEGFLTPSSNPNINLKAVETAMMNTVIVYKFQLFRTESCAASVKQLAQTDKYLNSIIDEYAGEFNSLVSFESFNAEFGKDANGNVQHLFGKQLRLIKGCSPDFASAISSIFGTPAHFRSVLCSMNAKDDKIELLKKCQNEYLRIPEVKLEAILKMGSDSSASIKKKINTSFLESVIDFYS